MQPTIVILNGPSLNLLGQRQPDVYGATTLDDVHKQCVMLADELAVAIEFKQSNHEGQLVDWIQAARDNAVGIIINPAAYTHTSVAILDALHTFEGPVIEVHISNVHQRETFRHHSYVSQRANAVLAGCGVEGYLLALRHMASRLQAV